MYWPLRLPKSWLALQVLTWTLMGLCILAGCHALRTHAIHTAQGSRWWLVLLIPLALVFAFVHSSWLLRSAGVRSFSVPSSGMEPTILRGDHIAVDVRHYRTSTPQRRDIVVFNKGDLAHVKRIVAVEGDVIQGRGGTIFVNGSPLRELYIQHLGNAPVELNEFGPVNIPSGKLFVIGDNRDVSFDSRMAEFGEKNLTGRALYVIGPRVQRDGHELR